MRLLILASWAASASNLLGAVFLAGIFLTAGFFVMGGFFLDDFVGAICIPPLH
jgi:hypothetical protein